MSSTGVQCHATNGELLAFVLECIAEHRLHAVLMWERPAFRAYYARDTPAVASLVESHGHPPLLRLTVQAPVLPADGDADFLRKNPSSLSVEFGKESASELGESFLGAKSEDEEAMRLWRRIAARWKRRTLLGATVVNPRTAAHGFIRSHRYTAGALALAQSGVRMWALGGKSYFELGTRVT